MGAESLLDTRRRVDDFVDVVTVVSVEDAVPVTDLAFASSFIEAFISFSISC
jgi:hypothetical protein